MYSQIEIHNEVKSGTTYRLTFLNNGYVYGIDATKKISFQGLVDDGDQTSYKLPTRQLFIALPAHNRSPIRFNILRTEKISNVIPERNNRIVRLNDSLFQTLPPDESIVIRDNKPHFEFKGYLWIGNSYCAHIIIHPYSYNGDAKQISEIKEFSIEIEIENVNETTVSNIQQSAIEPIIVNKKSALRWQSQNPSYNIAATDSWIDYSQEYLKIGVRQDAIYRITYSDLLAQGLSVGSLNPKNFKIFLKGKEIPIYVYGEQDNTFDPSDYIEFLGRKNYGDTRYREINPFGTSYYEYLNLYSDTSMYWLSWNGATGQRIDTVTTFNGNPTDTLRYYDHLSHTESDLYWDFSLSGSGVRRESPELFENETWNHGTLSVGTTGSARSSITFSVANLFPNKQTRAFAKVSDYASSITSNAHNLSLSINNHTTTYDSGFIDKFKIKTLKAQFLSNLLVNGNNTVHINTYSVSGNSVNSIARDWYELEYPRYLRTTTDSISFGYSSIDTAKIFRIAINGFTSSTFSIYKFTLPDSSLTKITNFVKSNDTIYFSDSVKNGTSYFINRENKIGKPLFFYKKTFSNLRSTSNQADYIAITHPYFQATAASYVSFIASSYGVSTKLVDVNDIYDEFNYGFLSPHPIREFLKSTYSYWQSPKPKNLLLIGKATYDFYGNKTRYFGVPKIINFVPSWGNPVSDIQYVLWDTTGAYIPQMAIGRIPAKTTAEFQSYFLKHQKYVSKGYDDWNKRYLLFSGGNFNNSEIISTKNANDFIVNNYIKPKPIGGTADHFYKTQTPISNFGPVSGEYVSNSIKQGAIYINYIGHSGTETWDNSITNISQLENIRDRNPLIADFGCSTAKHAEPDVISFSEQFVTNPNGQAIGYIGNSSLGYLSSATSFPQLFSKILLVDSSLSIGETHRVAKTQFVTNSSTDFTRLFMQTNSIIGDPIVKLAIPTKPNFSFTNSTINLSVDRPTENQDSLTLSLKYFNLGKVIQDSVSLSINIEYQGQTYFSKKIKKIIPLYVDSISVTIPIKSKSGEYTFTAKIDSSNSIEEIYENDNAFSYNFIVANSSIRNAEIANTYRQTDGLLSFVNPVSKPDTNIFKLEVSLSDQFSSFQTSTLSLDTFITKITLDNSYSGKRIWTRTRNITTNTTGLVNTYFVGTKNNYLRNDSVSFSDLHYSRTKYFHNKVILDTTRVVFHALSGGVFTGPGGTSSTVLIEKDGVNYVPENTTSGYHIVLFDATNFTYLKYYLFNISNVAADTTKFRIFLDTLTSDYIMVASIAGNGGGGNLNTAIKSRLKLFGSALIDNVGVGHSWTIIGRKGSPQGSVPEQFRGTNQGNAIADTTIIIPNSKGNFSTENIGPVATWNSIETQYQVSNGSNIKIGVIGTKNDNSTDTLLQNVSIDTLLNIAAINAQQYPYIRLFGELNSGSGNISPSLSSIGVNFKLLPELGVNFQVFKSFRMHNNVTAQELIGNDSVSQGEKVQFKFRVYNVGGVPAKNIPIKLSSNWDNNYTEQFFSTTIDSIAPENYKEIITEYNTALGNGKRNILLSIDPDTTLREIYKDNNFFVFPFIVKKSSGNPVLPNLTITQNLISSTPNIITDEIDTALFKIIYSNSGSLVNDSISIQIKHFYQSNLQATQIVRRKYPISNDTFSVKIPILKRAGEHQVSAELDYNGLIVESSESDNQSSYFFNVATTDFKVIHPAPNSISTIDKIIFLNPTINTGSNTTVSLEIDSLQTFSTAQSFSKQLETFATSFSLPNLKKLKRYFWRVKILNSGRDWTTGSFFSGDSSLSALGQLDSVAWKENVFTRVEFSSDSGARIVDTKISLKASSAGFSDGNNGLIEVNGVNVITSILGSGHNVVVLDSTTFAVQKQRRFDLAANADESDSLTNFIQSLNNGVIVIDVVVDEGANNLSQSTRNALKTIGSAHIDQLGFRDSWAIIGRKGAAIGSVPEILKIQSSGIALVDTTIIRSEKSGMVVTPLLGPFNTLSQLVLESTVPIGSQLKIQFVGLTQSNTFDTLLTVTNQNSISLSSIDPNQYRYGKLVFHFSKPSSFRATRSLSTVGSPILKSWKMTAAPSTELAVSSLSTTIDRSQVMEGESIEFFGKVFNVSTVTADSVTVQLKTNASGIDNILKQQRFISIPANDSVTFSFSYNTRGKRGNHAFTFEIDPSDSVAEQTKSNNSVTIPYIVHPDTLRPTVQITFDGMQVVNGDYVSQNPLINIRYIDNNPAALLPADTTKFKIRLNNILVPFIAGEAELLTSNSPGKADVRWTPKLSGGENIIQISAQDVSDNNSDTILLYVNVATEFRLMDIYNLPNPFSNTTHFTFNLAGPTNPDEVTIKIYTVAGRLIQELNTTGFIGFNKILWDGRDRDGDQIGNGVYLYKVIVKQGSKQVEGLSKLVKMR